MVRVDRFPIIVLASLLLAGVAEAQTPSKTTLLPSLLCTSSSTDGPIFTRTKCRKNEVPLTKETLALILTKSLPSGPKGDKGDVGAAGVRGVAGPKGDTGLPGSKGEKGDAGLKGESGAAGLKGETGAQGVKGEKGEQGVVGAVGPKGETGSAGARGPGVNAATCYKKVAGVDSNFFGQAILFLSCNQPAQEMMVSWSYGSDCFRVTKDWSIVDRSETISGAPTVPTGILAHGFNVDSQDCSLTGTGNPDFQLFGTIYCCQTT